MCVKLIFILLPESLRCNFERRGKVIILTNSRLAKEFACELFVSSDSVFNAGIIEFMKGGRANEKVI